MKRPEGTNLCQKLCSSFGKLHQCNSQDSIDSILFVMSRDSTVTSLEAGICLKDGVGAKAGIGSDTGTGSDTRTSSEAGICLNNGVGAKAGICLDAGTGSDAEFFRGWD
jgi:hypothetical protein